MINRISVLHILYSGQGGLGSYFVNFVKSDHQRRFRHHAFFYGKESLYEEYKDVCVSQGIPYQFYKKEKQFERKVYKVIKDFILRKKIDAVIFHTFSLTPLLLLHYRLPVRWIAIDHTSYAFKTRREKFFTLLHHVLTDLMVYFQHDQFKALQRTFPFLAFGKHSIMLSKNIESDLFYIPRAEPVVMTIGMAARMVPGKRFDLVIQAIHGLRDKGVIIYAKFAGDGPMRTTLELLCDTLKISDLITFVGILPFNKMPSFYHSLTAYVHATEGETACYSIMEAQASGVPVLASDVKGINNIDERGGVVLFQNSVGGLISAITLLSQDEAYRSHLSQEAIQSSRRISSAGSNAEVLYNRLLTLK